MEPTISVTIAVAVLLGFVLYSGFTLATLGQAVRGAGSSLAGTGLPIAGSGGVANQLTGSCLLSRNATTPVTIGSVAVAEPVVARMDTTEQSITTPPRPVMSAMTAPRPAPSLPASRQAPSTSLTPAASSPPKRIVLTGDSLTDPVGEPPPLLWLRDPNGTPGTKDLTQSGNGLGASASD